MTDETGDAPKIIIDSDWKAEAQAEKEKLSEAAEQAPEGGAAGKIPPADFRSLMGMLATQALMYMGGIADPQTGRGMFDPEAATHMIDLLAILEEKTKGNLTDEESKELTGVVNDLRTRFVEIARMVAAQQAGGGAPGAPGAPGGPAAGGPIPGV